jgi:hypothetical protein
MNFLKTLWAAEAGWAKAVWFIEGVLFTGLALWWCLR